MGRLGELSLLVRLLPHARPALLERPLITVRDKIMMVRRRDKSTALTVLYCAPVPLSSSCYFGRITKPAINIATIHAIQFLNSIQVLKFLTIDSDIPSARDIGQPIQRKANPMIDFAEQVSKTNRDDHHPDKWRGSKVAKFSLIVEIFHSRSLVPPKGTFSAAEVNFVMTTGRPGFGRCQTMVGYVGNGTAKGNRTPLPRLRT